MPGIEIAISAAEDKAVVASLAAVMWSAVAMLAPVVVELVANPAAAEVEMAAAMPAAVVVEMAAAMPVVVTAEFEMVVNTGHTEASFAVVLPPVVKLCEAGALHQRL